MEQNCLKIETVRWFSDQPMTTRFVLGETLRVGITAFAASSPNFKEDLPTTMDLRLALRAFFLEFLICMRRTMRPTMTQKGASDIGEENLQIKRLNSGSINGARKWRICPFRT
jgi:hypothetical protein